MNSAIKSYEPLTIDDVHEIMGLYRDRRNSHGRDTHDLVVDYKTILFEPHYFEPVVNLSIQDAMLYTSTIIRDGGYGADDADAEEWGEMDFTVTDHFDQSFDENLGYYGRPIVILTRFEDNAANLNQLIHDDGLNRQNAKSVLIEHLGMNDPNSPFHQAVMSRTLVSRYLAMAQIIVAQNNYDGAGILEKYPFTKMPENVRDVARATLGYIGLNIPQENKESYKR